MYRRRTRRRLSSSYKYELCPTLLQREAKYKYDFLGRVPSLEIDTDLHTKSLGTIHLRPPLTLNPASNRSIKQCAIRPVQREWWQVWT
jgi:hypothetical protein